MRESDRMSKRYIITFMAANRVGILAAVTTSLAELGGDIQEVSQTVMQRFFTIIMSAEFPENRDPSVIIDHIRGVCRPFGVEVNLKDPKVETLQELPNEGTEKYTSRPRAKTSRGWSGRFRRGSRRRESTSPTSLPGGQTKVRRS